MNPFKHPTDRKERSTSRNFVAPTKDQATTGRFMPAGDSHGVGFRTPVGKESAKGLGEGPIPFGCKAVNPKDIA